MDVDALLLLETEKYNRCPGFSKAWFTNPKTALLVFAAGDKPLARPTLFSSRGIHDWMDRTSLILLPCFSSSVLKGTSGQDMLVVRIGRCYSLFCVLSYTKYSGQLSDVLQYLFCSDPNFNLADNKSCLYNMHTDNVSAA